ncbi:MAG: SIMPL domain-containing protein [Candidatus Omnitrophica bacterium]|nr:SIMPL domain-containing protein [Candidatus Omnitrophota bacterium]
MKNTITVHGIGKVTAKADVAYVILYVKTDRLSMVNAAENTAREYGEIEKSLKNKYKEIKNISAENIMVGSANNSNAFIPNTSGEQYFEIVKRIIISLPPTPQLAYKVIDTATKEGATINVPSFTDYFGPFKNAVLYGLLSFSKSKTQAKEKALNNAKDTAEKLASLVGKRIGNIVSICLSNNNNSCSSMYSNMGSKTRLPTKYLGLNPEKIKIHCKETVTYELLKK